MAKKQTEEVTAVEQPVVRPRFIVAPGHTLCHGNARYQPGDVVAVGDQEQINVWLESGAILVA